MDYFELTPEHISRLNDGDLRELVGRLCEAEIIAQGLPSSAVTWGGAQEAPDGGLDVSVKFDGLLPAPNFIPRASTGIQVKKHSMSKAACAKEMLANDVPKPVIASLARDNGAYIIVSGKDDCSDKMLSDRVNAMKTAAASIEDSDLLLDFYGRDRLAGWLRRHPSVSLWARSKLGLPLAGWRSFSRWAATPSVIDDSFLEDEHPCITLKNNPGAKPMALLDGIKAVREQLSKSNATVRITGLSGVGKTRFAQALFEEEVSERALPKAQAIYADLGEELSPSASALTDYLLAHSHEAYLVLDNCPPDVHRALQKRVSQSASALKLLTIEYDISDDKPEETDVVHMEPSSEANVSKLVFRRYPKLGEVNAKTVAEFSGGNARVALALASCVERGESLSDFSDEQLFQRMFSQRKGQNQGLLESAEVLSLVYSFNVSNSNELQALSHISGIPQMVLLRSAAELLRRQLAQKRGDWRAVLPHALANRLAKRALENLSIGAINAELLKDGNLRLLKSCAHRLGYLHDFEPAINLANSWIAEGGPLHDITTCSSAALECLNYIAPIFPDTVLRAIETAASDPKFCSRTNIRFNTFVRLLCHIAYEAKYFDRAVELLLRFAETEKAKENVNSIVDRLKQLFSLYLSGTQATPEQRQAFVIRLLHSSESRHHEIAGELIRSAFETSHWTSMGLFDFGARKRNYGWTPKTWAEKKSWYLGFIELLVECMESPQQERQDFAKSALAFHFRGLWTHAGCTERLAGLVHKYAKEGGWPKVWISIKSALHYDKENLSSDNYGQLLELETIAAPIDLLSDVESYVFIDVWEHAETRGHNFSKAREEIFDYVRALGQRASGDFALLQSFGAQLWGQHTETLGEFGKGLAEGAINVEASYRLLLNLAEKQPPEDMHLALLYGYLNQVYESSPGDARELLKQSLGRSQLQSHAIYLLSSIPLEESAIGEIKKLAAGGSLEAWRFTQLSLGRLHEAICDEDLSDIIRHLLKLEGGIGAALQILNMRFHIDPDTDYSPSAVILSCARQVIAQILQLGNDDIRKLRDYHIEHVAQQCLAADAPKNEISDLIAALCEGVESHRIYSFELEELIGVFIQNHPEKFLDHVFADKENRELRVHLLLGERGVRSKEASLNDMPADRLIQWCNADEDKIRMAAHAIRAYEYPATESHEANVKKACSISPHALALLEVAHDKEKIVEAIFNDAWPMSWSGSRANILEARAEAFGELLHYPAMTVSQLVKIKLPLIKNAIEKQRAEEERENHSREQSFE